ncbi:MAG: hypothetical protein H6838_01400 [Planctomycetes bacterium]|nr:hypothetical protein [Planctomycetota bacterium]MCB9884112.1 hypothetical protein [Planctomycetota bacterium]
MAAKATKSSPKKPSAKKSAATKTARKPAATSKGSASKSGDAPAAAKSQIAKNGKTRTPVAPAKPSRAVFLPRAIANLDDEDVLMSHGGGGAGFGRCGGRLLSSKIEQLICHKLGLAGVVHSHSPRHYEVRYEDGRVAAYAPMIVLRGRGREGKSVVIEAVEEADAPIMRKVIAFRSQYGQEFYIIFVASDDVLDEVTLAAYDESCAVTNVNTLIARLAE